MNQVQERTLSMQKASILFLDAQSAVTATIPGFTAIYAQYKSTVADIQTIANQQSVSNSKDQTDNKKSKSEKLIMATAQLSNVLNAYFITAGNTQHVNALSGTAATFRKLADNNLISKCQEVHDIALAEVAHLAPYGVTAATLGDMQAQITDFASVTSAPRVVVINRAGYTAQLATLFETAKTQLNHLSILVKVVEYSNPSFYLRFLDAIKITNLSRNAIAFRLSVRDQDGKPQTGFTLTLYRLSNKDTAQYRTNPNGVIIRRNLPEDVYEITLTKTDYAPLTGKVAIIKGETYPLVVQVDTVTKTIVGGKNTKTGETV